MIFKCLDHPAHVAICHLRIHRQEKQSLIRPFGHRTQAGAGAKMLAVERVQVYGDVVNLRADAPIFQGLDDFDTRFSNPWKIGLNNIKVINLFAPPQAQIAHLF